MVAACNSQDRTNKIQVDSVDLLVLENNLGSNKVTRKQHSETRMALNTLSTQIAKQIPTSFSKGKTCLLMT